MPTEIKAHECNFCKKLYRRQGDAVRHEPKCSTNPNNQHQCFKHCKHLHVYEESEVVHRLIVHDGWDEHREDDGPNYKYFTCKFHKDMQLYSYKLEAKKAGFEHFKANWGEDGVMRMPTSCEHYEDKNPDWDAEPEPETQQGHIHNPNDDSPDDLPF